MPQMTIQQALQQAVKHHQAGELPIAESLYRQVLSHDPQNADALHLLGLIARRTGNTHAAIDLIRQAIALRPLWAPAHNNLGNALAYAGQLDEAVAMFDRSIALDPNVADTHTNRGSALATLKRYEEAIPAYQNALKLRPADPQALSGLGHAMDQLGQHEEAIDLQRQALAISPNFAEAQARLAAALASTGPLEAAVEAYRRAVSLNPTSMELLSNLGNLLKDAGQLDLAIAAFNRAIELNPASAEVYNNLGSALRENGLIDQAIVACRQSISLKPDYALAFSNLGFALTLNGLTTEARQAYQTGMTLDPADEVIHSNYLMTMYYEPGFDNRAIGQECARWEQVHAVNLKNQIRPHDNDRDPDRRLKIGYVSPDFMDHPVGRFLEPLLANHDRQRVEVIAYSRSQRFDAMSLRLRSHTDGWQITHSLTDAQLADQIRADHIDILVDLSLHSGQHRLLSFACKPAPVQVCWLAYPGGTGLKTIDYRLSDRYLDPPGMDESVYAEQTHRLPDSYWCYQAHPQSPAAGPPPALQRRHITFGSLNNFFKVSPPVLRVWAEILRAVPGSRLLLHTFAGSCRQRVTDVFRELGVDPERIEFTGRVPAPNYFEQYHRIDIALDTFPFAGGTTTCDAVYMGVPVVTMIGKTGVGRGGLSILSNVGVAELCADSVEEYIQIAVDLADDLPRLTTLHGTLRPRMRASPLMDAPRFARNIEAAYRAMWQTWCASRD